MPADNMQADMASGPTVGGIGLGEVVTQLGEGASFNGGTPVPQNVSAYYDQLASVFTTTTGVYGLDTQAHMVDLVTAVENHEKLLNQLTAYLVARGDIATA